MKVGILIGGTNTDNVYAKFEWAKKLGFDNCQLLIWDVSLYTDEFANEVKRAMLELDFEVTAVWCGWSGPVDFSYPNMYLTLGLVPSAYRGQRIKDILCGAEFARKLGVRDIVTHIGYLPDNPFDQDRVGTMVAIRYICKKIAPYGQRFLFETGEVLPNSLVQFIKEIGYDNIGINYDPANMMINGRANSYDALCMFAPYLCGFHGKDGLYPQDGNPKGKEVMVGKGGANFPKLIEQLFEIGYDGYITIEREIPDSPERDKEIIETKKYLEDLIIKNENKFTKKKS